MIKNIDTIAVSGASGILGGSVAYISAVKGMGIVTTLLWQAGLPVVILMSGPIIVATAVGAAVVGGGAYCVGKAIVFHKAKLEDIAHKNDFKDGPQ
jgi:hypothetical protein